MISDSEDYDRVGWVDKVEFYSEIMVKKGNKD